MGIRLVSDFDEFHPTVGTLRALMPEVNVAGGCFASRLPHPARVSAAERRIKFEAARSFGVEQCIRMLLGIAGLPESTVVPNGDSGERIWPEGFVGSLTHKGTVVLGVMARTSALRSVGIDLERVDKSDFRAVKPVVAARDLPAGIGQSVGTLLTFSAKEAVFKTVYPLARRSLDFCDVHLDWGRSGANRLRATAYCANEVQAQVRCAQTGRWLVSAAFIA